MIHPKVITCESPDGLLSTAAKDFAKLLNELAATKRGPIRVILTGGTLGIAFIRQIDQLDLDLSEVWFMFGDERYVGLEDPDRNEHQGLSQMADQSRYNLIRYPDGTGDLDSAGREFSLQLSEELGDISSPEAVFDLVILGVGPDGHVASLFPGHLHENGWIVAEADSPKPPSKRLSLSYQALNKADNLWVLASGEAKANVVSDALNNPGCELPLSKVSGKKQTRWYLDQELSDAL